MSRHHCKRHRLTPWVVAVAMLLASQAAPAMDQETQAPDVAKRLLELETRLSQLEARGVPVAGIGRISRDPSSDRQTGYWDGFWVRRSLEGN